SGGTASPAFEGVDRLAKAVRGFQSSASALDRATDSLARRGGGDPSRLARVNDALMRVERALLLPDGLPGRPWFKHAVYAPGLTTGYASWPLPGVRQAVLDNDPTMLAAQAPILAARIDAATQALRSAESDARAASAAVKQADRGGTRARGVGT